MSDVIKKRGKTTYFRIRNPGKTIFTPTMWARRKFEKAVPDERTLRLRRESRSYVTT